MNKELYKKAHLLNEWILQQEVVKEYKRYELLISNHQELKQLENELKDLQKQIVQLKHQDIDCQKIIEEYQIKKQLFDENPIVHNYLILKEEVNDLIHLIQKDIIQQLSKKIDYIEKNV